MKRCPQCEFIYEDDQLLCDLDQFELVQDSLALIPVTKERPGRPRTFAWIGVPVLFIAMLLLGFLTLRTNTPASPPQYSPVADADTSPLQESKAEETESKTESHSDEQNLILQDRTAPTARAKSNRANASRRESNTKVRLQGAQSSAHKKDSKVESALKKTGRLLKKPFKF